MSKTVLKRYAPFYIAVIVTGIAMVLLFLRPDTAVGLSLVVEQPLNVRNGEPGFKVLDPTTGAPEVVTIVAELQFESKPGIFTLASLDIELETGDLRFKDEIGINLPLGISTGENLTDQLLNSADGSTLFADVRFNNIKKFTIPGGYGYGYGYTGGSDLGGLIQYILSYTPPPFTGDYKATIRVTTDEGGDPVPAVTRFSVLDALGVARLLSTLYPTSDVEGLPEDLVILQLDVTGRVEHIAIDRATALPKVTVTGVLIDGTASMIKSRDFHPSLREKWRVDDSADLLLPFKIPAEAKPGSSRAIIRAEDIAGQSFITTAATSPRVEVASTRRIFNVYILPSFTFLTPPLQCFLADCTADFKFKIKELLDNQTVKGAKLNPAFLAAIGKLPTDDVPLSEVVEKIFAYDIDFADFVRFNTDPAFFSDLSDMGVGRGYILKTKTIDGDIEPFKRVVESTNPQFPATGIPFPLKLAFRGKIVAVQDEAQLPTTVVKPRWNLVGAHAEKDTTVGILLAGVTVPIRLWEQIIAFRNQLDISLDEEGKVKLREGKPEMVFERKFKTLLGPDFGPQPSGDLVPAGAGLWLFMCERPADPCLEGGEIGPVLQ